MAVEMLSYADLASRLKVSPEAARALAKRLRLPRARGNDGKALVSVDFSEINHAPLPARAPAGHQAVTGPLKAKIETLQAELAKIEAMATGHRADFERERDRADKLMADADKLMAELLKMTADAMTAKEATARLEGELATLKARPWWRRLAG
jgi:phage-related minor tail protein